MDHQTQQLLQKIANLEVNAEKQNAALNFILTHIITLLDRHFSEEKFSDELKNEITSSLSLLGSLQSSPIKSAINQLLQPAVRPLFGSKPEPFVK